MKIFKYPIKMAGYQIVNMPFSARILTVAYQNGTICLWALVEEGLKNEERVIEIFGTGHHLSDDSKKYIGTLHDPIGLVWHIFELDN